jgi:hypothetical protein
MSYTVISVDWAILSENGIFQAKIYSGQTVFDLKYETKAKRGAGLI